MQSEASTEPVESRTGPRPPNPHRAAGPSVQSTSRKKAGPIRRRSKHDLEADVKRSRAQSGRRKQRKVRSPPEVDESVLDKPVEVHDPVRYPSVKEARRRATAAANTEHDSALHATSP